jgi:citrate lyase subunit beta/citryl-CoA lyase
MLQKAGSRGADVLILDLEDGVHPNVKVEGRDRISVSLDERDFGGSEVWVRVNPMDSPWGGDDLALVGRLRPDGVVLPKVDRPEIVEVADEALGRKVPLYLMVETAGGVLASEELAAASERVSGLLFGAADFRESLRAGRLPEEQELTLARSQILLAARAAGIEAFDTPWFEFRDLKGLEASARRVRSLGFDGKTAIHPCQVPLINELFSPTSEEIERARNIVEAMRRADGQERYVAVVDGEMVEALHLNEARRTLDRAKALGLVE